MKPQESARCFAEQLRCAWAAGRGSCAVEIVCNDARMAYRKSWYPGAKLADPLCVALELDEIFEVMCCVQFMSN